MSIDASVSLSLSLSLESNSCKFELADCLRIRSVVKSRSDDSAAIDVETIERGESSVVGELGVASWVT